MHLNEGPFQASPWKRTLATVGIAILAIFLLCMSMRSPPGHRRWKERKNNAVLGPTLTLQAADPAPQPSASPALSTNTRATAPTVTPQDIHTTTGQPTLNAIVSTNSPSSSTPPASGDTNTNTTNSSSIVPTPMNAVMNSTKRPSVNSTNSTNDTAISGSSGTPAPWRKPKRSAPGLKSGASKEDEYEERPRQTPSAKRLDRIRKKVMGGNTTTTAVPTRLSQLSNSTSPNSTTIVTSQALSLAPATSTPAQNEKL